VPCTAYTDPRLAECYDPLNPFDAAHDFYLALASGEPKAILDMGCGTGPPCNGETLSCVIQTSMS
jgi:hypothetical protein